MQDKAQRTPVIDPLLLALKSRRVLIAISALLVGLLVLAVPELTAVRGEIVTLVITLALALIGGYSIEDAANAGRERSATLPDDFRELVKSILLELLDDSEETE